MSSAPPNAEALKAHAFKPGQSGNPGGKPAGARNKLQGAFINALADDFAINGRDAIESCRRKKPDKYLAVIASLMPKEIEVSRPLGDLSDDELESVIATVRALAAARTPRDGESAAQGAQPAAGLPTLREAG